MTSKMNPLLERNEQFARTYTPVPLGMPAAQVIVVTCLDHRVDPAITLGLGLGEAPVVRNAGGRVTRSVIEDIAYLAYLGRRIGRRATRRRHEHRDRRHSPHAMRDRLSRRPRLPA